MASVHANLHTVAPEGARMRVVHTGKVGRVRAVDLEWARLFPHKGPMLVLDVEADRQCYSLCELEPVAEDDVPARAH